MTKEVRSFIERRFPIDNNWCTGNCYWFARILCMRFPQLIMWYLPIENHWMAGTRNGEIFFDWKNVKNRNELNEEPVLWDDIEDLDELLFKRLHRDCIN